MCLGSQLLNSQYVLLHLPLTAGSPLTSQTLKWVAQSHASFDMEQFTGQVAFIVILGTWVMNSMALPLQPLGETMPSHSSTMTTLYPLSRSEEVISFISKPVSRCASLD